MSIDEIISQALAEDLGDGDHTSLSTIPVDATRKAKLLAKQQGVIAGIEVARMVFLKVDPNLSFMSFKKDGEQIQPGDIVFEVEGKAQSILSGERLALNFLQRMSGIATHTFNLTQLLAGLHTKLLDTRKTTPLLRELEKYAVRMGGGHNHRKGLYDMILIKDNHIDFAGGIREAINSCRNYLVRQNKSLEIEIEVRNFDELNEVLDTGGINRIMLDNFSPIDLAKAVKMINGRFETEASGGITEHSIRSYAETGVDFISVGALTHQIKSLDMSLLATS
ncbi:MAG: carboxylating nicotinate-nucleotide diphosphorylase [Bacteroidales bacterium]|nr:carboxylating nicotinate-nucleotide diphosphorylase [Bacteroidales bacterium]